MPEFRDSIAQVKLKYVAEYSSISLKLQSYWSIYFAPKCYVHMPNLTQPYFNLTNQIKKSFAVLVVIM